MRIRSSCRKAICKHSVVRNYPLRQVISCCIPSSLPGVVTVNMSNMTDVDGTNARDLNRAEYVCRKQLPEIIAFLRRHVPGYEGCYLIDSADVIGVRETRRFEANYQLNEQDIAQARTFEDWVVTKSNFFFDLHNVEGAGLDANGEYKAFKQPKPYTIPLRCFVPKTVEGILAERTQYFGYA